MKTKASSHPLFGKLRSDSWRYARIIATNLPHHVALDVHHGAMAQFRREIEIAWATKSNPSIFVDNVGRPGQAINYRYMAAVLNGVLLRLRVAA